MPGDRDSHASYNSGRAPRSARVDPPLDRCADAVRRFRKPFTQNARCASSTSRHSRLAWAGTVLFAASLVWFLCCYVLLLFRSVRPAGQGATPARRAVAIDVLLFSVFALHHSLLARTGIKRIRPSPGAAGARALDLHVDVEPAVHRGVHVVAPVPGVLYRLDCPWRARRLRRAGCRRRCSPSGPRAGSMCSICRASARCFGSSRIRSAAAHPARRRPDCTASFAIRSISHGLVWSSARPT